MCRKQTAVTILILALTTPPCLGGTGRDWKKAESQGTVEAYESFLRGHPDGKHAEQAKQRIWERTKEADSIPEYETFLERYPESTHTQEVSARLAELKQHSTQLDEENSRRLERLKT